MLKSGYFVMRRYLLCKVLVQLPGQKLLHQGQHIILIISKHMFNYRVWSGGMAKYLVDTKVI